MTTVIKRCRGQEKRGERKNRWIQKKVDDSRIWNFRMPKIRSQIKYILFRIDVYFTEYLLAVEIDEKKKHVGRDLIFEEKRQEVPEKKLGCEFIRTNSSKHYDGDYEIGRI